MNEKRQISPDVLRIISAICVIAIHVTSVGMHDFQVGSNTWTMCVGLNSVLRWAVPEFIMISGMLFLNPKRQVTLKKLFQKNILRILLCIVVWGGIYSFLDQFVYGTISAKSVLVAIYGIVTANTGYHLWFLYTLVMLYIGVPIFRLITENASKKQLEYILLLWFIVYVCMGHLNGLINEVFGIGKLFPYTVFPITGYAGYFMLGDYLHRFPPEKKQREWLYAGSAISCVVCPILSIAIPRWTGTQSSGAMLSPDSIGSCLIAVTAFVAATQIKTEKLSENCCRMVRFLSDRSFGIYLIHVFWITLIFRILKVEFCYFGTVLSVPVWVGIIAMLSLGSAWLLSLGSGLKKLV